MEVPDARVLPAGGKPRTYSWSSIPDADEIERITVKPSTELVPDEYEHDDNRKGLVLIFYSRRDVENMEGLRQALYDQEYDVPDSNLYKMTTKEFVLRSLRDVAQSNHKDKTCFILIFLGNFGEAGEDRFLTDDDTDKNNCILIREVWSLFTSDRCPTLKYKPKIFIFQASKKFEVVESDSDSSRAPPHGAYDIPAEADMLLIYKKVEDPMNRHNFIEQLCNNIHDDGHKDDMIGIVTHTDHKREKRPLIISTLTRKFYVRSSNQRGRHHDLHENHDAVIEILQDLSKKINTIQEQQSVFKRKLEQNIGREAPPAASSNAVQREDSTIIGRGSPKMEPGDSKKMSMLTDSKTRKPLNKPWKY